MGKAWSFVVVSGDENIIDIIFDGTGICYDEENSGMYYYQLETVTPIMSIGVGKGIVCRWEN